MSNKTKNSLSNLADNLIKLQQNNSEILSKLSEVVNSDAETVTFTLQDEQSGSIKTVTIPSLGNIKKDIQRLESNLLQMSSLNEKNADVRLKDGTFRTIIASSLKKAGSTIQSTAIPSTFNSKNNWFFESFLNPYLYVGLDYTGQINPDTKKVKMVKFILNLNSPDKLELYNQNIKNNPDLTYSAFLDLINENGISYAIDDDILDLPPVEPRYYGNFSVLRVFEDNETVTKDNVTFTIKNIKFQLDKLFYNDKNSSTLETQQLKVGDSLLVNKNTRNTRYIIKSIDFERNIVSVDLVEGFDSVSIGADILSFYSVDNFTPQVQVGIGFNEYLAVFIKPIDPISNIPADVFSPCIGFYTNDLTINDNGVIKNLGTYYQESVVDFGAFLFSMAKENIPPASKGIKPDAPTLTSDIFKVVQVNKHATDIKSNEDLKKLNAEKNEIKSKIQELDKSISNKRLEVSTKNYKSNLEKTTDANILRTLIDDRDRNQTLYNSIVSDILSKKSDVDTIAQKAKYRVRGFWDLPLPKTGADGKQQEIIQFHLEYRYITKDGAANNLDEFSVNEEGSKGIFSNWMKYNGPIRERVMDINTGTYIWKQQDLNNGDEVNINQLDIPISPNEGVEIRIKSISEAGYPSNPLQSDWSEIITVNFPSDLDVSKEVTDIFKETESENVKIDLINELVEKGVYEHVNDQFTQNNTLWKHQSLNIASGFLSNERNVISLFDYLKGLENKILSLEEQLSKTRGNLVVTIEDSDGNQKIVNNNEEVQIFAGNYKDIVSDFSEPKGVIIGKSYFLRLSNPNATPIELVSGLEGSNLWGSRFDSIGVEDYNNTPIGILDTTEPNSNSFTLPFGSRQVKGQCIFNRVKNLKNNVLYTSAPYIEVLQGTGTGGFIKSSSSDEATATNIQINTSGAIYVHALHPITGTEIFGSKINEFGTLPATINSNNIANTFVNEKRISFREEDKFLIGPGSCGAFLFMSPSTYQQIRVDGSENTNTKKLEKDNDLVIQIQFQFRMTDYYGAGTTGTGNIGGLIGGSTDLEYRKQIGFDIFWNTNKFRFDLEVFSRYSSNSLSINDIPTFNIKNTKNNI